MADTVNKKPIIALMTEFEKAVAVVEDADKAVIKAEAAAGKAREAQAAAVAAAQVLEQEINARVGSLLPNSRVRTG